MSETIGDTEAFLMHDFGFHVHLALGSRNMILIEIARGVQEMLLENLRHIIRRSETIHPRSLDFHWKIFRAIETGKPKLARKHMTDHLQDIEEEVYAILKRDNKKG
jgi:DNA-binding FadR family transcriptional regulator